MRRLQMAAAATVALAILATMIASSAAPAAGRAWKPCSKTATKTAAEQAGLPAQIDGDAQLRRVFGEDAPSSLLKTITRSLCVDFDGDGDLDRLALYGCCTVSSPAPFAILRKGGPGGYAIAYSRLNDAVRRIRASGRDLVEEDPRYAATDANCCPSRIRERRIHWSGTRFRTTVRIRRT